MALLFVIQAFFLFFLISFSTFLRVFLLFFSFFSFIFFLLKLLNTNLFLSAFDHYIYVYKFELVNVNYLLSFDCVILCFILLSMLLFFISVLLSWNLKYKLCQFLLTVLFINLLLINVFAVIDLIFFYVFFEALLIPMFLLIGIWGSRERKVGAAFQFFLYTLFGSLFMFLAIFFMYSHFGSTDFRLFSFFSLNFSRQLIFWLFFFFAIAVKVPMLPVHIWLPEAHVEAPTVGSVILAGVLLKLGLFAMLKFVFPSFAFASIIYTPLVFLISLIGIYYASSSTLAQIDMKKMVAYSSVAHMNFAVLGLFAFNFYGLAGSIVLMLAHGLVSSGLFICVGSIYDRYKTRLFIYYGGLIRLMPFFTTLFFILVLSNMSFPCSFNFVGELLVFFGLIFINFFVCLLSGVTLVLSAAYSLALFAHIVLGSLNPLFIKHYSDLSKREFYMLFTLSALTVLFGIFPNLLLPSLESGLPLYLDSVLSVLSDIF